MNDMDGNFIVWYRGTERRKCQECIYTERVKVYEN